MGIKTSYQGSSQPPLICLPLPLDEVSGGGIVPTLNDLQKLWLLGAAPPELAAPSNTITISYLYHSLR